MLYYVCFASHPEGGWVDSQGFEDLEAARGWAETAVASRIEWFPPEER